MLNTPNLTIAFDATNCVASFVCYNHGRRKGGGARVAPHLYEAFCLFLEGLFLHVGACLSLWYHGLYFSNFYFGNFALQKFHTAICQLKSAKLVSFRLPDMDRNCRKQGVTDPVLSKILIFF